MVIIKVMHRVIYWHHEQINTDFQLFMKISSLKIIAYAISDVHW